MITIFNDSYANWAKFYGLRVQININYLCCCSVFSPLLSTIHLDFIFVCLCISHIPIYESMDVCALSMALSFVGCI